MILSREVDASSLVCSLSSDRLVRVEARMESRESRESLPSLYRYSVPTAAKAVRATVALIRLERGLEAGVL